jgi:hypothetical protein
VRVEVAQKIPRRVVPGKFAAGALYHGSGSLRVLALGGEGPEYFGRKESASAGNRGGRSHVKAAGRKFDDGFDPLAVQAFKPLHNVVKVGVGFQIFEDDGNRHKRALEHPRAAYLSRNAFHRWALRSIERRHGTILLSIILYLFRVRADISVLWRCQTPGKAGKLRCRP